MNITLINVKRKEKSYTRMTIDQLVERMQDSDSRHSFTKDLDREVCFAAEWMKRDGTLELRQRNPLVLLSLENLRDLATVQEYKRQAALLPYTMLCFIGQDGHSLRIVCTYTVADGGLTDDALLNAFRKYHYIYSSQLGTPLAEHEPAWDTACPASFDPRPYFNPTPVAVVVFAEREQSTAFRLQQEEISDYNFPEEVPGLSLHASRVRRFHDCLDAAIETCRTLRSEDENLFATAVLEQLADGCREMGLPQAWCARLATFIPMLGGIENSDTINSVFQTAYLHETLKTIPLKFTRPSALLTYKTEAYMKEHYTLRLNVMTGTPEYRLNAVGYGFMPLNQAARNTMAIKALKAGVDSWDRDLSRFIESNLIPKYYPMEDYLSHLPRWNGKRDYVGELASRVETDAPHWAEDFHKWMLSMVAQWLGKDRQYGNAIVPLLIGPQGSGKTTFCRRLLPGFLRIYYNDRLSMKNDNDIFIAMSSYALINIDEFDAMSKNQQPLLKYLISKQDIKFRPPYGKVMQERQRFASFIATTNNRRPLVDPSGSRRFICVYAEHIDNTGTIPYDQLYAQLYQELQEGRRYWFEDEENARIMRQNEAFQQVSSYEKMVELTYLSPEATPDDAEFIPLQQILRQLTQLFPNFNVTKGTGAELGKRMSKMGYERKRTNKGAYFKVIKA